MALQTSHGVGLSGSVVAYLGVVTMTGVLPGTFTTAMRKIVASLPACTSSAFGQ